MGEQRGLPQGHVLREQESTLPATASPTCRPSAQILGSPTFPADSLCSAPGQRFLGRKSGSPSITRELTWRGGETYVFSCSEEKGDQEGNFSVGIFLSPAPELTRFRGLELKTCRNESQQARNSYGQGWWEGRKRLTSLSAYLFWGGLQNSEMCLLFSVGKLTRNRYRGG